MSAPTPQYSLIFARQNPTFAVTAAIFGADMVPTRRGRDMADAGKNH
jgi:hypothetical protein